MSLALKRVKVYLKLFAIIAIVVVILLTVYENQDHKARLWFFWFDGEVNVLWLILVTALLSVVSWWSLTKIFGTVRELRELRRHQFEQQKIDQQRRLAQELAEREKRIDEKLRRSISEEGSDI